MGVCHRVGIFARLQWRKIIGCCLIELLKDGNQADSDPNISRNIRGDRRSERCRPRPNHSSNQVSSDYPEFDTNEAIDVDAEVIPDPSQFTHQEFVEWLEGNIPSNAVAVLKNGSTFPVSVISKDAVSITDLRNKAPQRLVSNEVLYYQLKK